MNITLNSLALQAVQACVELIVVPLHGRDLVEAADGGQSVDDVCTQEGVNVVWGEFGTPGSVLGPVGHVAHQLAG